MAISRARTDYEYVVYPSTRVEGSGIKIVPSRIGDKRSLDEAKAVARAAPGSGIYSVTRGRFIGWITPSGRYSSTSRGR